MGATFIKLGQFLATRPDIIKRWQKIRKTSDSSALTFEAKVIKKVVRNNTSQY